MRGDDGEDTKGRKPREVGRAFRPWCKSDTWEGERKKVWVGGVLDGTTVIKMWMRNPWVKVHIRGTPHFAGTVDSIPWPCSPLAEDSNGVHGLGAHSALSSWSHQLIMHSVAGDMRGTFHGFCPLPALPFLPSFFSFLFFFLFFSFLIKIVKVLFKF